MSQASEAERYMLDLINAERTSRGIDPLQLELRLNDAAEDYSRYMLDEDFFSHTGLDGSRPDDRMEDAGFVFSGSWSWGENIALQSERGDPGIFDDVYQRHVALMNSSGHRANILNPNFEVIGIGIELGNYKGYEAVVVTQNFALSSAPLQLDLPGSQPDPDPEPPAPEPAPLPPQPEGTTQQGTSGADALNGDTGNDTIVAGGGNDTVAGGDGNDDIDGGRGADQLWGGLGADTIEAGNGNDRVGAGAQADEIHGGRGNDTIWAGNGNDTVYGEADDDNISGGSGNDHLWAGEGNDTIFAGNGNDRMSGLSGNDELWAGAGNDQAFAGAGNDTVLGLAGNDDLWGGADDDRLDGGAGQDTLRGGSGDDTLIGGADSDVFVFSGGADQVNDFATGDHIDLSGVATITDFTDLVDFHLGDAGSGAVIDDGQGNSLTLDGIDMNTLVEGDFIFVA